MQNIGLNFSSLAFVGLDCAEHEMKFAFCNLYSKEYSKIECIV